MTNTKGLSWENIALKPKVLMGLFEYGYDKPSPVQEEVLPYALAGNKNRKEIQEVNQC